MTQLILIIIFTLGLFAVSLYLEKKSQNTNLRIGVNICLILVVSFLTYAVVDMVYIFERMSLSIHFGKMLELIENGQTRVVVDALETYREEQHTLGFSGARESMSEVLWQAAKGTEEAK